MGSGNPPAQQEEIYRYSYVCAHTYSQSCEASLHTPCTVASMSGLGWPLTTEGCKGLAVTPTFPPRMLEMHAAAIEATSGLRGGKAGVCCPDGADTAAMCRISTGLSLPSVQAETALSLSARQFATQKNEAWKCIMLSRSFSAGRNSNQKRESC